MVNKCVIPTLAAMVLLLGCASKPPVAEVRMVAKAFNDLSAASQPLLDDMALAEREQGKTAAEARAEERSEEDTAAPATAATKTSPIPALSERCPEILLVGGEQEGVPKVQTGFCLEDSYYYSELADPPATGAFRRALAAVGNYTDLLVILAEGRNIDEARGQLGTLAGNLAAALQAVGVSGAGVAVQGAIQALDPLIKLAAEQANAAELERVVREDEPKVEKLILALRAFAGDLFRTLTGVSFERFNTAALENREIAEVEAKRIEGYRVAVSNYVVLLDRYRVLLADVVAAYDKPRNPVTLATLADRSAQLSAQADLWRRTLASLRTGLR
jgi:hypothetical protein